MIAKSTNNNFKAVEVNIQRIRLLCGTKKYRISAVVAGTARIHSQRVFSFFFFFLRIWVFFFFFFFFFFFCLLTP
jgi:hypothetical protein